MNYTPKILILLYYLTRTIPNYSTSTIHKSKKGWNSFLKATAIIRVVKTPSKLPLPPKLPFKLDVNENDFMNIKKFIHLQDDIEIDFGIKTIISILHKQKNIVIDLEDHYIDLLFTTVKCVVL